MVIKVIDKIISIIKSLFLIWKDLLHFEWKFPQKELFIYEDCFFKKKNDSDIILMILGINIMNIERRGIKENKILKIKNNKKNKHSKINNYIIIRLIKFIIINIFCQIKSNMSFDLFHFQNSKITLKIKGIGDNTILGNESSGHFTGINFLKEVYINGIKQDEIEYQYYFNQSDNFVELAWNNNITNCDYMFYKCSNITEINLSNFNTTQVTDMFSMFYDCSSLTSLDLSNFDTSQVTFMHRMFCGCSSLISLDLSSFNTTQVTAINSMFQGCSSLISLDLSNFNTSRVKKLFNMFFNCSSLTSLNISNFNTSGVTDIHYMFFNCSSLTSLYLSNFDT